MAGGGGGDEAVGIFREGWARGACSWVVPIHSLNNLTKYNLMCIDFGYVVLLLYH